MNILEIVQQLNFSSLFWQIVTPLLFSLADIITGYIQAVINHTVDSQKMRQGLYHKVLIILVLFLSFVLGLAFNIMSIPTFACVYVVLMELFSIVENLKKAGIDIGWLSEIVKDKTEDTTEESINKLTKTLEDKKEEDIK